MSRLHTGARCIVEVRAQHSVFMLNVSNQEIALLVNVRNRKHVVGSVGMRFIGLRLLRFGQNLPPHTVHRPYRG